MRVEKYCSEDEEDTRFNFGVLRILCVGCFGQPVPVAISSQLQLEAESGGDGMKRDLTQAVKDPKIRDRRSEIKRVVGHGEKLDELSDTPTATKPSDLFDPTRQHLQGLSLAGSPFDGPLIRLVDWLCWRDEFLLFCSCSL